MTSPSPTPSDEAAEVVVGSNDPSAAGERTALAWTRSALNMAASATLIARASFAAHLAALGLGSAVVIGAMALFTWAHGRAVYQPGNFAGGLPPHRPGVLGLLTGATLLIAVVALAVTIAI